MKEAIDLQLLDKRVVERYIRDGVITRKQYQQYLRELPDVSHLVEDGSQLKVTVPSRKRAPGKGQKAHKGTKAAAKGKSR